ncbi:hypothetical protein M5K25_021030 [Dendrobium thyrsiflorum]|uniref:PPIase cyclophilin-type domain-containing protein n=1 Tax=Dendrobium thyrsiflorum TaxID=117978 RepID=A0ABD0UIF3_DENTH
MSSVYVLEPPTKGKVAVNTTMGPIDIELWPKEAPNAVRNFVQLCLEGYYDNTIFHRIIKSFVVQGGDPTGTGTGGESIYGDVIGLIVKTLFSERLGDVETDKDDRPIHPAPKILSVEVVWNPFDDIVPRQVPERLFPSAKPDNDQKEQKQKAIKKLNVLSFGDEVEEDDKESESMKEKIRSIHDVLDDPLFLKGEPTEDLMNSTETEKKGIQSNNDDDDDDDDDEDKFDARMRSQILKKRRELGNIVSHEKVYAGEGKSTKNDSVRSPRVDNDSDHSAGPSYKVEKLALKKKGMGSEARAEQIAQAYSDLQLLSHGEQERQIQKQKKRRNQGREEDTLAKLEKFKQSLADKLSAPARSNSKDNDADQSRWLSNQLKFSLDHSDGQDAMARKNDPNEYVVHDPLLEKGKEKFNRMQAKLKRREREWAGKSLT